MSTGRPAQRGVSLIEALVALTVMAFGMLGIVGLQATLRTNSDIAKQRAEAVRIAQAGVEDWRAFETLASTPGVAAYADIVDMPPTVVPGTSNATFTRTAVVTPAAPAASAPQLKTVTMSVAWSDRSGQNLSVNLVSSIAAIPPELAGALALAGDRAATQQPRGRHRGIPAAALQQSDGTSIFAPPGSTSLRWVFNNVSGVITKVCTPECVDANLSLLSGYIRFATDAPPVAGSAEAPSSAALLALGVRMDLVSPSTSSETCYTQTAATAIQYFCALPVTAGPTPTWSGRAAFTGIDIAATLETASASQFKVCRYAAVVTPAARNNAAHPLDYVDVSGALQNQNYLVIKAGDGLLPFTCPADDPATTYVNGNTWPQQPAI